MIPSTSRGHSSAITGDFNKRIIKEDSFLPAKKVKQEERNPSEENQQMNIDDDDLDYGDESNYDNAESSGEFIIPDDTLEGAGIPNSLEKFISLILHLPSQHHNQFYDGLLEIEYHLKRIRDKFIYQNISHYLHYNVPYLLCRLGKEMAKALAEKGRFPSLKNCESVIDAYVLMKEEFNRDIDFKLSLVVPKNTSMEDYFQPGDIVLVKMKTERYSNDTEGVFLDPVFIGIFLSAFTRVLQPELFSIENIVLDKAPPEHRNDYLCQESVLRTMNHTSLYDRSDYHLGIHKLVNCLPTLQSAKALYMLDDYLYKDHFLNPVMVIKTSGVGINEELITDPSRADTYQKANDLVGQNDPSSSSFLAVHLEIVDYQSFITPVLKQLVSNLPFFKLKEEEKTPILIIAENEDVREDLYTYLKEQGFNGRNEVIVDPSIDIQISINDLLVELYEGHIATLEKDIEQKIKSIERYSKCIDYLKRMRSIKDLSPHWIAEMSRARKDLKRKLLKEAKVIITTFERICNDPIYLTTFNPKTASEQRILCCIICEAHNQPELDTLALTNFGIKKYMLLGSVAELKFQEMLLDSEESSNEIYLSYSRSLFERMYSLHSKGPKLINSAFVEA